MKRDDTTGSCHYVFILRVSLGAKIFGFTRGGNISAKFAEHNLSGKVKEMPCVKGDGSDLDFIDGLGFSLVRLPGARRSKGYGYDEMRELVTAFGFIVYICTSQSDQAKRALQGARLSRGVYAFLAQPRPAHLDSLGEASRQLSPRAASRLQHCYAAGNGFIGVGPKLKSEIFS